MKTYLANSLKQLKAPLSTPLLRKTWEIVRAEAEQDLSQSSSQTHEGFNSCLGRARTQQRRLVNALTAWKLTGETRFKEHAFTCLIETDQWPHWSSEAEELDNRNPNEFFDLSYGENSLTLAVGFDALEPSLSTEQKNQLIEIATRRSLQPFLTQTDPSNRRFWYNNKVSNWNSVCCGGAGILSLALQAHLPSAMSESILEQVETSLRPLIDFLATVDGGWTEGIGYWNYGMRYLFHYLLSWETSDKGRHPALDHAGIQQTLSFPICFSPRGCVASFGDVNSWSPLPIHLTMARHLGDIQTTETLIERMRDGVPKSTWAEHAEFIILNHQPEVPIKEASTTISEEQPVQRRFRELDWMVLADRQQQPNIAVTIRGGEAPLSHGHLDLLSFNAVVSGEAVLTNIPLSGYLPNTFGHRRWEIPEITSPYKNSLLINGVGPFCPDASAYDAVVKIQNAQFPTQPATVASKQEKQGKKGAGCGPLITTPPTFIKTKVMTHPLRNQAGAGYALTATKAYGYNPAEGFVGRCFWLTAEGELLMIDHTRRPDGPGVVETRWHTQLPIKRSEEQVEIYGKEQSYHLHLSASVPATLTECRLPCLTHDSDFTTLRWLTEQHAPTDLWLATLLTKDGSVRELNTSATPEGVEISWIAKGASKSVRFTSELQL